MRDKESDKKRERGTVRQRVQDQNARGWVALGETETDRQGGWHWERQRETETETDRQIDSRQTDRGTES